MAAFGSSVTDRPSNPSEEVVPVRIGKSFADTTISLRDTTLLSFRLSLTFIWTVRSPSMGFSSTFEYRTSRSASWELAIVSVPLRVSVPAAALNVPVIPATAPP